LTHLTYLAVLAACLIGTAPLELVLHVGVYAQRRRLLCTLVPVVVAFGAWDIYAIHRGMWSYDPNYLIGVTLPGRLPLEELLFFIVIPVCAVLTFEAVLTCRPGWRR
jgi:lycopene cyclase domain-containing protein